MENIEIKLKNLKEISEKINEIKETYLKLNKLLNEINLIKVEIEVINNSD